MQRSDNGEASSYTNYTAASAAGGESTPQSKPQSSARCSPPNTRASQPSHALLCQNDAVQKLTHLSTACCGVPLMA